MARKIDPELLARFLAAGVDVSRVRADGSVGGLSTYARGGNLDLLKAPAFKNKATGEVRVSLGPTHGEAGPEVTGGAQIAGWDEEGFREWAGWWSGFIDGDGKFYDRAEAWRAVHSGSGDGRLISEEYSLRQLSPHQALELQRRADRATNRDGPRRAQERPVPGQVKPASARRMRRKKKRT